MLRSLMNSPATPCTSAACAVARDAELTLHICLDLHLLATLGDVHVRLSLVQVVSPPCTSLGGHCAVRRSIFASKQPLKFTTLVTVSAGANKQWKSDVDSGSAAYISFLPSASPALCLKLRQAGSSSAALRDIEGGAHSRLQLASQG